MDGFPDVIGYREIECEGHKSPDTYIFKQGYGPSRSSPENTRLETQDTNTFYKNIMPVLMKVYERRLSNKIEN
jgi:hypothetical protein